MKDQFNDSIKYWNVKIQPDRFSLHFLFHKQPLDTQFSGNRWKVKILHNFPRTSPGTSYVDTSLVHEHIFQPLSLAGIIESTSHVRSLSAAIPANPCRLIGNVRDEIRYQLSFRRSLWNPPNISHCSYPKERACGKTGKSTSSPAACPFLSQ